jgi:hypothetical protein
MVGAREYLATRLGPIAVCLTPHQRRAETRFARDASSVVRQVVTSDVSDPGTKERNFFRPRGGAHGDE